MAEGFWVRSGGVWNKAREVYLRSSGVWRTAKEVWYRSGGSWHKVFTAGPTLLFASASSSNGTETGSVNVSWSIGGSATGWTLTVDYCWVSSGIYTNWHTGANGGSSPQTIPYWGMNIMPPPAPGEALSTDALIRVSLRDGSNNHAPGSPYVMGPGISV